MPSCRSRIITEEIATANLVQIGNRAAQSIGNNGPPLAISFALDIPKLKGVKKIAESHAIEIVRIDGFLDVSQLHRSNKNLKRISAAITATRPVRISFGHDHSFVPKVLSDTVVDVILTRLPTAVI